MLSWMLAVLRFTVSALIPGRHVSEIDRPSIGLTFQEMILQQRWQECRPCREHYMPRCTSVGEPRPSRKVLHGRATAPAE